MSFIYAINLKKVKALLQKELSCQNFSDTQPICNIFLYFELAATIPRFIFALYR